MKLIQVKAVTNNFQQTSLEIIWLWTSVHWEYSLIKIAFGFSQSPKLVNLKLLILVQDMIQL